MVRKKPPADPMATKALPSYGAAPVFTVGLPSAQIACSTPDSASVRAWVARLCLLAMVGSLVDSTAKATRSDESSMSAISAVTSATPWVSRKGLNSLLTTICASPLLAGAAWGALPACPTLAPQSVRSADQTTTNQQDTCQPFRGLKSRA